jgi:hypothetical protein
VIDVERQIARRLREVAVLALPGRPLPDQSYQRCIYGEAVRSRCGDS